VPDKYIPLVVQSLPIADVLDRLPEETRTAFIEELGQRLNGYLAAP
jgi:hypothetical protein